MLKKLISFLLCLVMIIAMIPCAFADEESKETFNYVSLGASQTVGYGLAGNFDERFSNWQGTPLEIIDWTMNRWNAKTWNPDARSTNVYENENSLSSIGKGILNEKAFPMIVKNSLEDQGYDVNFSQLALNGMRSDDLLCLLDENYQMDEYSLDYFFNTVNAAELATGLSSESAIAALRTEYQEAVKNADLISYDLGSNNFGYFLVLLLQNDYRDADFSSLLNEDEYKLFMTFKTSVESKVNSLLLKYGVSEESIANLSNLVDMFTYTLVSYCTSFDKTVAYIYENNPDVQLVVTQLMNYTENLKISVDGVVIPLGELISIPISFANYYTTSLSKYKGKFYYARLSDNKRVKFILDDFLAYSGPEDLSAELIELLDIYDDYIRVKSQLTPYYMALGRSVHISKSYNETLTASYDATIKLLQYIYNNAIVSFPSYVDGDESQIATLVKDLIGDVAVDIEIGEDYQTAVDSAINRFNQLSSYNKNAVVWYVQTLLGKGALSHPNADGHKTMAEAVTVALESENIGYKVVIDGYKNLYNDLSQTVSPIEECTEAIVEYVKNSSVGEAIVQSIISNIKPLNDIPVIKKNVEIIATNIVKVSESRINNIKNFIKNMVK